MGESWLTESGWTPWAIGTALYLFGMATGWLIWGERHSVPEENNSAAGADDTVGAARPAAALDALETEIKKARDLLAESEEEAEALSAEVSSLDQTVKRANGRLKLILRAVQRAVSDRTGG